MSEELGAMRISLSASTVEFEKNLKSARDSVAKMTGAMGIEFKKLTKSLSPFAPAAKGFAIAFTAASAAAIGATAGLFKLSDSVAETGDQLAKASQKSGVAVSTLSELKFAGDLANVSFEDLTTGLKKLNVAIAEALVGKSNEAVKKLGDLGIAVKNVDGSIRPTNEILLDLADSFSKMEDGAFKVDAAVKIFGKSGANLIPLLNEGRAGIKGYAEEAKKLGVVFDQDLAAASERFKDSQTRIKSALQGVQIAIARELIPVFADILEDTTDWIAANRELLAQDLEAFAKGIAGAVKLAAEVIGGLSKAVLQVVDDIREVIDTPASFGPLKAQVEKTSESVELLSGVYGIFIDDLKLSKGEYLAAAVNADTLKTSMTGLTAKTNEVAAAWANAKGPMDDFFTAAIANIKAFIIEQQNAGGPNAFTFAIEQGKKRDEQLKKTQQETAKTTQETIQLGRFTEKLGFSAQFAGKEGSTYSGIIGKLGLTMGATNLDTMNFTGSTDTAGEAVSGAGKKVNQLAEEVKNLALEITKIGKTPEQIIELEAAFKIAAGGSKDLVEQWKQLRLEQEKGLVTEETIDQVQSLTKSWTEASDTFNMTAGEVRNYTLKTLEANAASLGLSAEGLAAVKKALQEAATAASNINFKEGVQSAMEEIDAFGAHISESLEKGTEDGKEAMESLSDFIGNVVSNISDTVADMLTAAFTGSFDDITRSWKDMLKNMLNIFFQFVAAVITNPIRIALEGALGGGEGGNGGGGGGDIFGTIFKTVSGLFTGLGESFRSLGSLVLGEFGASFAEFGATLSAALPAIGVIISAALIAIPLIIEAFKKTPQFAFKFESVETEIGERAAQVSEFLDADFFSEEIFQKLKARGGKGAFSGKEVDALKEAIQKTIADTIESIQAIIFKLPADMAAILNEAFLNTAVDMETKIGRSNLLGFDAKGAKEIKERLEKFFGGELQARFIESVRSFFVVAYEALGVLPEKAQEAMDEQFEAFKNAKSPEERAKIGQEALAQFNAFVDAFNFAAGRFGDSAGEAIDQIKALAMDLGFEGIPTFEEMSAAVKELLANAEIDPETIEKFKALREAIVQLSLSLSSTAISLVQFIDALNTKIVSLGGSAMDTSAALQDTIDSLIALINSGGLSFAELQQAFQQLGSALDMQYAKELEKAQARAAAQQAGIQKQINAKQEQLRLVTEKTNAEIDGLKAALDFAERFKDLAESIREDLRNLFTGPNSVLTGIEKLNFLQGEVAAAAQRLAGATTQEGKLEAIEGLRDLQNELIDLGSSAFGTSSPEFQALFRETADQLQALVEQANKEGLKADSLQDKITKLQDKLETQTEKLNASIKAAQDRLADLGAQEVKLSGASAEKLRQTYEWLREQAQKALEEVNKALKELGVDTSVLEPQLAVASEQLVVQRETLEVNKEMLKAFQELQGFSGGSGGFQDFGSGTLAMLHHTEAVIRPQDVGSFERNGKLEVNINMAGDASEGTKRYFAKEVVREIRNWVESGDGRDIIRSIK